MALERRGNGYYLYTSKRVGKRVYKIYGGGGPAAVTCAKMDELFIRERVDKAKWKKAKEEQRAFRLKEFREWLAGINGVVVKALEGIGWHQHKSEWRLKRGVTMTAINSTACPFDTWVPAELSVRAGTLDAEVKKKAQQGDTSTIKAVDEFLKNSSAVALWGDVGRFVLVKWVTNIAGDDLLTRRATLQFASNLRSRLAGPSSNALELLLAERIVIAWVFASWTDWQYASKVDATSIGIHEFHFKRMELANRQLLSACRALAKVKRAKLPDVLALVNVSPPQNEANSIHEQSNAQ